MKNKPPRHSFTHLRSVAYLKPYKWFITGGFLLLVIASGCKLLVPLIIKFIIDKAVLIKNMDLILLGGTGILTVAFISGLSSYFSNVMNAKFSAGMAFDLRNALYKHTQHLSFSYHDRTHTGQLLTRMTSDIELIRNFVHTKGYQILMTFIMFTGSFILLIYTNAMLALIALPFMTFSIWVSIVFAKKIRPFHKKAQEIIARLNTYLKENLSSIKLVKAFNRQGYEILRFNYKNREYKEINIKTGVLFAFNIPLIILISNFCKLLILGAGGYKIIYFELTIGELVAFNSYLMICLFQLDNIKTLWIAWARARVGAERIFQILDTKADIENHPGARELPAVRGHIEFRDVSFKYFEGDKNIIDSISFKTSPGQKVVLVGETGSGKSTIVNLIPRFYDVTDGSITIDGNDIRSITLESLRRQVGCVLQEPVLFKKSIRENIAYGRPESTYREIHQAAEAAEAHDFISVLPEGYDTVIAERGGSLSGGQKQRIAIARTLLINPAILILDDSTSSVDSITERKIHQALERIQKNKLCFIIAQRMSTVKNADLILIIDNGKVAASGIHEELIAESSLYAEIYYSQLKND